MIFASGVELAALGVVGESEIVARVGTLALVVAALVALACSLETVKRVARGRRRAS